MDSKLEQPGRTYRYYDLIMASFVCVLLCANLVGVSKAVTIGGFTFGAGNIFSITYAQSTGLLYVGQNNTITVMTTGGAIVGGFGTNGGGPVRSLAYDASDNSLWYLSFDGSLALQTDILGNLLQRDVVNLGGNYWGGEIAPNPVPEPASFAVLGLGALALLRRRKKA